MFYLFSKDLHISESDSLPDVIYKSPNLEDVKCLRSFIESNSNFIDFIKFYIKAQEEDFNGDTYFMYVGKKIDGGYDLIITTDNSIVDKFDESEELNYVCVFKSSSKLLINDVNIFLDSILKCCLDDFIDLVKVLNGEIECKELSKNLLKARVMDSVTYGLIYNSSTKEKHLAVIGCVIRDDKIKYLDLGDDWIILKKSKNLDDLIFSM